jgi:hypothetical protein
MNNTTADLPLTDAGNAYCDGNQSRSRIAAPRNKEEHYVHQFVGRLDEQLN